MIKVENKRIELSILKNKKVIKNITFKNTLTDQYLDMIIYYMLPQSIGNILFPDITITSGTTSPFSIAGLDFTTPKQNLNTSSTTANYTDLIYRNGYEYDDYIQPHYIGNGKEIESNYEVQFSEYDNSNNTMLLQYILFFSKKNPNYRLASFFDLSSLGIYGTDGLEFKFTRYDSITSNEIPLETLSPYYDFLPVLETTSFDYKEKYITKISLCYGANASGNFDEYSIYDLSFEKISSGIVEITGFNNFYIGTYDYPQDDYPQDDYPQEAGGIKSAKFTYSNGTETYVNIENLDFTYDNTELKIRLKCERGVL